MNDQTYMKLAIDEAKKAFLKDEVPIGAVIVDAGGDVISRAHNQLITLSDPTAHAEILALRKACQSVSNYRLPDTTMYVTIEPCVMCMGAIIHARVAKVVFGAHDPKWGAAGSKYDFIQDARFNHTPQIAGAICAEDCKHLMQCFFREKRKSVASNSIMS